MSVALNQTRNESSNLVQTLLPRVSVVLTCFNYGKYVTIALQSVAKQTYPNWHCVVVDDASTDDSVATIEEWLTKAADSRFRLIKNDTNQGHLASIANGLAASESEFVAVLDADDFWFPEFIQRHIEAHLNCLGAVSLTSSDELQVDALGRVIAGTWGELKLLQHQTARVPMEAKTLAHFSCNELHWDRPAGRPVLFLKPDIFRWHWTTTSAKMFRRTMLNLAMPVVPQKRRISADLYLTAISHYFTGSIIIDEALGAYRRHGGNYFASNPLFGSESLHPTTKLEDRTQAIIEARMSHVLDRQEDFVAFFGKPAVHKFVRSHFKYLLSKGRSTDGARIRAMTGTSTYYWDRSRIFFRRLFGKKPIFTLD